MEELSGQWLESRGGSRAAVFLPTAFIPRITGKLYQQFAVTIAISPFCFPPFRAFKTRYSHPALARLLSLQGFDPGVRDASRLLCRTYSLGHFIAFRASRFGDFAQTQDIVAGS